MTQVDTAAFALAPVRRTKVRATPVEITCWLFFCVAVAIAIGVGVLLLGNAAGRGSMDVTLLAGASFWLGVGASVGAFFLLPALILTGMRQLRNAG